MTLIDRLRCRLGSHSGAIVSDPATNTISYRCCFCNVTIDGPLPQSILRELGLEDLR